MINRITLSRGFEGVGLTTPARTITTCWSSSMRKKGVTVSKTINVIIGTYFIEKNAHLLHYDQDFIPMEKYLGLPVVSFPSQGDPK